MGCRNPHSNHPSGAPDCRQPSAAPTVSASIGDPKLLESFKEYSQEALFHHPAQAGFLKAQFLGEKKETKNEETLLSLTALPLVLLLQHFHSQPARPACSSLPAWLGVRRGSCDAV